jgi:hypothetical protein
MPGASANTNSSVENSLRHRGGYYIEGADLIIRVENTLFRVHRYFFTRDSAFFRDKLPQPPSSGDFTGTQGSSDKIPLVLDDASKVDFERLLWVFYNPKYSLYDADVDEWTSILKLAHQWDFIEVKQLAIRELEALSIPSIQKVVLYQTYEVNKDLLQPAFIALATRDDPITIDEGREIGLETALQLARARELARLPVASGRRSSNPRSPVNIAGVDLDALIEDVFNLTPSNNRRSATATSQTSTGRGTPAGGRATTPLNTQSLWSSTFIPNLSQAPEGSTNGSATGHTNGTPSGNANNTSNTHTNGTNSTPSLNTPLKGLFNVRNPQK